MENILSTISEDAYSKCALLKCYINFEGEPFVFYLARKTRSRCSLRVDFFIYLEFFDHCLLIYLFPYSSLTINIFTP